MAENGVVESNASDIFKTDPVKLIFDVLRRRLGAGCARAAVFKRSQGSNGFTKVIGPDGLGRRIQREIDDDPCQKNP